MGEDEAAAIVRRMSNFPLATLVRVAEGSAAPIGRALDAGADGDGDGVIVPLVNTTEQAADPVAPAVNPIEASEVSVGDDQSFHSTLRRSNCGRPAW